MPKREGAPVLEDYVSGAPRHGELILDDFRQRDPNDGDVATQPTTAYLSYDSQNLYVAFVSVDRDPMRIRARGRRSARGPDRQTHDPGWTAGVRENQLLDSEVGNLLVVRGGLIGGRLWHWRDR